MSDINKFHLKKIDIFFVIILFVFSLFIIFSKINLSQLDDWDEGIYANISGDIVENNNWFTQKLQGLDWYEKEPLPYWLMAISIKTLGFNVFAVRFPFAILSAFIAPLIYLISNYYTDKKIYSFLLSIVFFVNPILWNKHSPETGNFDTMNLSLFLLSITLYLYLRDSKKFWISALFISLTLMTRGVMGFLFFSIIILSELTRPLFNLKRWSTKKIILFLFISITPWIFWHTYSLIYGGKEYINIYWKEQFFSRIDSPLQGHHGTYRYYIDFVNWLSPDLLKIFFLSLITALYLIIKKQWQYFIFLIWFIFIIVPIQIMQTKLAWYIIPALPIFYLMPMLSFLDIFKKTLQKYKAFYILFTILIIFYATKVSIINTKKIFLEQNNSDKNFIEISISYLQEDKPNILLYETEGWIKGRTLPTFYWYLYFENQKKPLYTDRNVLKNKRIDLSLYNYIIVENDNLKTLDELSKIFTYKKIYNDDKFTLIHIEKI